MDKIIKRINKDYFLLSSILILLLIFVFAIIFSDFNFIYKKPIKYIEITQIEHEYNDIDNNAKRLAKNTNKADKEKSPNNRIKNYSPPSAKTNQSASSKKEEIKTEEDDKRGDLKKSAKKLKEDKNDNKKDAPIILRNSLFMLIILLPIHFYLYKTLLYCFNVSVTDFKLGSLMNTNTQLLYFLK